MVIGNERGNWYDNHPPACICAARAARQIADRRFGAATGGRNVGRDEPCPCGSGK